METEHLEAISHQSAQDNDLRDSTILAKYTSAAEIANHVADWIREQLSLGEVKSIVKLCSMADKLIEKEVGKVYTKGKIEKGLAFPTCLSVNHCVGHFSPLSEENVILHAGDLVKVDLGVHIDGYIAQTGFTWIMNESQNSPIKGRLADLILATHLAAEAALRLLKPGQTNTTITDIISKIATEFQCQPLEGVLSHQLKRFVIDGDQVIPNRLNTDEQVDQFQFQAGEAYTIDIVLSTGDGKARELDVKPTVFRRNVNTNYALKMKSSRAIFGEICQRFSVFPFPVRALEEGSNGSSARLGVFECQKQQLLEPFLVLYEKSGEFVAQFKFTALILPSGVAMKLTDYTVPSIQSDKTLQDPAIIDLLKTPVKLPKTSKRKNATILSGDHQAMDISTS